MSEPRLFSDDIALEFGVTRDTVCALIAEKETPVHRIGRVWEFPISEIDHWLRRGAASRKGGFDSGATDEVR